MTAKADGVAADPAGALAERLGITSGMTVLEIGYDSDTDVLVGEAIVRGAGQDPVGEDFDGVVDLVVLWWREGDDDLVDMLVDAMPPLVDNGVIWLLTPKFGEAGCVEPADIAEAAATCGMRRTTSASLAQWSAIRLVSR